MAIETLEAQFPNSPLSISERAVSVFRVSNSPIFQVIAEKVFESTDGANKVTMRTPNKEKNRPAIQLLNGAAIMKNRNITNTVPIHTALRQIFQHVPSLAFPLPVSADRFRVEHDAKTGRTYVNLLPDSSSMRDIKVEKRVVQNTVSGLVGTDVATKFQGFTDITVGIIQAFAPAGLEEIVVEIVHDLMPLNFTLDPASYTPHEYWTKP